MSVRGFILRLVGRHPEQLLERRRFEENLRRLEEKDKELDELVNDIRDADRAIQSSKDIVLVSASQYPPPGDDNGQEE